MRPTQFRHSINRWTTIAVLVALISCALPRAGASCPRSRAGKICSGHGTCDKLNQCVCDPRFAGYDCSEYRCPAGPAWAAPALPDGNAHYPMECSNRGICDRSSGECRCMQGFTGSACQRLSCNNGCAGAGECISLQQLSKRVAVASEPIYDHIWDAEMIYGCLCRKGFLGYDCSQHACPFGDDPLTTDQVHEKQLLQCSAASGSFWLFFKGKGVLIPASASLEDFEASLRKLPTMSKVHVTFSAGSTVCNGNLVNVISIEFIEEFGPQPRIKVFGQWDGAKLSGGDIFAASGGSVLAGVVSVRGTKEWEICSNRGDCDYTTGTCRCYNIPLPGFRSSDGHGRPGIRGDCGAADDKNFYGGPILGCVGELACSGHGYCTGSPSFRCVCEAGWTSGDCSWRTCPSGSSWFRAPSESNVVHNQWSECSDAGSCDRTNGRCNCHPAFTGIACEHMKCPGYPVCNGHGQCMAIRQLSLEAEVNDPNDRFDYGADPNDPATYDSDSILSCKCDKGFEGYDCSLRSCPVGDDPTTQDQVDEIQLMQCTASGGSFQLQYKVSTTRDIQFDAAPEVVRDAILESLDIEEVEVTFSSGSRACTGPGEPPNIIRLVFPVDHGDLPPVKGLFQNLLEPLGAPPFLYANDGEVLGTFSSQRGTKESVECSNRGICDRTKGECKCEHGFGSSDGRGKRGGRNDCGYRLSSFNN